MEIGKLESDKYIYLPRELRDCSVVFQSGNGTYTVSVSYNYAHNQSKFIPFQVTREQFEELLSYVELNELYRVEILNYIRTLLNQDQAAS